MQFYILVAVLLTLGSSADSFESLNLDPQLVIKTNTAIACAKA